MEKYSLPLGELVALSPEQSKSIRSQKGYFGGRRAFNALNPIVEAVFTAPFLFSSLLGEKTE